MWSAGGTIQGTSADRAKAPAQELQKMTTKTNRTAARSAALASIKAIAITVAVVLAGTLFFVLLGSHLVPDFTGPFAQERYGEIVGAGGEVVQGAAEHASELGEQADSMATGTAEAGDADGAEEAPDAEQPPSAPLELPSVELALPWTGQEAESDAEQPQQNEQEEPPLPLPLPPAPAQSEEEEAETEEAPAPDPGEPAPDGCSGRPAGWPGCPEGSTQDTGEFIASQLETRPPTDPEEIAANAEASGNGGGAHSSRDEILARVGAVKNPAPRDAAPSTATAGSVTRIVDGDTLAIGGVDLDLSLVAVHPDRHDDATRHTRQACPVGSTASYVLDTGRGAASPDGTQRAKVWCFGPANTPATKSLNQELAEFGLAGASSAWQACKGSSFYKEPWAQAIGC